MKKPIIGITPALDLAVKIPQSHATHYLRRTYTKVLNDVGAVPIILNLDMSIESVIELCDGVIISGGEDLDPMLYGEAHLRVPGKLDEPVIRAEWEREIIDACDRVNMPILGICYGMQLLNIHYGGTLYQDIPMELPESISHDLTHHSVEFTENFLGYGSGDIREIESRHHQAVHDLAPGFEVCAVAPDGVVEAIRSGRQFGMQWHPESDITGVHVYRAFLERCIPALST